MTSARSNRSADGGRGLLGVTGAAAVVAVLAVGSAVYLNSADGSSSAKAKVKTVVRQVWPSATRRPYVKAAKVAWPKATKRTTIDAVHLPGRHRVVVIKQPYQQTVMRWVPAESASPNPKATTKYKHCWDFHWQQDAQAAYLANLSDPGALDGLAGPRNGNGIACEQLPVDPSRPKSVPVDAIPTTPTTAPSKATLLKTSSTYFGMSNDVLPGNANAFDQLDRAVGTAPSLVEFFDTWDHPYALDGRKVAQSWARGALPVLTWMPEPKGGTNSNLTDYTLDKVLSGAWDVYLYQWAAQVTQAGLPMGIRFAHEMNGSWYPWSAGLKTINQDKRDVPGGKVLTLNNTSEKYREVWQHVWNVFNDVGANKYVIWAWTPVKSLCTNHAHDKSTEGRCTSQYTTYDEDFPGAKYVDWVGLSSYAYGSASKYTFSSSFSTSFTALADLTDKPVFVAETGASQRITTPGATPNTFASAVDFGPQKAAWTTQTLAGFLDQGRTGASDDYLRAGQHVMAFVLFDNYVPNVHTVKKVSTETDWRFDSSPVAAAAFSQGVADPRYITGVMPTTPATGTYDPASVPWPIVPLAAGATTTTSATPTTAPTTSTTTTSPTTTTAPTTSTTTDPTTTDPTTTDPTSTTVPSTVPTTAPTTAPSATAGTADSPTTTPPSPEPSATPSTEPTS